MVLYQFETLFLVVQEFGFFHYQFLFFKSFLGYLWDQVMTAVSFHELLVTFLQQVERPINFGSSYAGQTLIAPNNILLSWRRYSFHAQITAHLQGTFHHIFNLF